MPSSEFIRVIPRLVSLVAALLIPCLTLAGCGRAPASSSEQAATPGQAPSPGREASATATGQRPTREDVAAYLGRVLPIKLVKYDVQADAPTPAPSQPGLWVVPVKLTLTTIVDLFDQPAEADVEEVNKLIAERNALITWRNTFAQSEFAKSHYANLKIGGPPAPAFIALKTPKGTVLPALYGKFIGERQVDRWDFKNIDLPLADLADTGEPREKFPANAVALGSPVAQAFLAAEREAIAQAKAKQAEAASAYRAMVTAATAPGVRYVGKITHDRGTVAAEVRFGPRPGGMEENAAFVAVLPNDPPYTLTFAGALNRELPMQAEVPDLRVHVIRTPGNGKSSTETVPGTMVAGLDTATERTFTFSEEDMKGMVNAFNGRHNFSGTRVK